MQFYLFISFIITLSRRSKLLSFSDMYLISVSRINAIFLPSFMHILHANFIPKHLAVRYSSGCTPCLARDVRKKNDYLGRRSGLRRQFDGKKIITMPWRCKERRGASFGDASRVVDINVVSRVTLRFFFWRLTVVETRITSCSGPRSHRHVSSRPQTQIPRP